MQQAYYGSAPGPAPTATQQGYGYGYGSPQGKNQKHCCYEISAVSLPTKIPYHATERQVLGLVAYPRLAAA